MDRLPLVSSCIIQVSQDIDEPWPVEVISHSGVAYNISMQPGDMALYESHSILHGRPFPLVGRHYVSKAIRAALVDKAGVVADIIRTSSSFFRRTYLCISFR